MPKLEDWEFINGHIEMPRVPQAGVPSVPLEGPYSDMTLLRFEEPVLMASMVLVIAVGQPGCASLTSKKVELDFNVPPPSGSDGDGDVDESAGRTGREFFDEARGFLGMHTTPYFKHRPHTGRRSSHFFFLFRPS